MAKVQYTPLVSGVSGRFGGMVFSRWQGVDLVRRFVPPSQPRTAGQVEVRNIFRNLTHLYQGSSGDPRFRDSWALRASGRPGIGRNFLIGDNVPLLQGKSNLADLKAFGWNEARIGGAPVLTVDVSTSSEMEISSAQGGLDLPVGYATAYTLFVIAQDLDWETFRGQGYVAAASQVWGTSNNVSHTFTGLGPGTYRAFVVATAKVTGLPPLTSGSVTTVQANITGTVT